MKFGKQLAVPFDSMADDDDAGPSEEVFEETESRESFLAAVDARRIRVEKLLSRCEKHSDNAHIIISIDSISLRGTAPDLRNLSLRISSCPS